MSFLDTAKERHSIRSYKDREIEQEKIEEILKAVNSAPSAGNLQAYEIVLVKKEKTKTMLSEAAYGQDFIASAPIVLVFLANPERSGRKYGARGENLYSVQDATIAAAYAQLAATSLGLGSAWVGAFDEQETSGAVNVEKPLRPIIVMPIGYPNEVPCLAPRRPLKDLVHEERI